jgi:hypothetical protein
MIPSARTLAANTMAGCARLHDRNSHRPERQPPPDFMQILRRIVFSLAAALVLVLPASGQAQSAADSAAVMLGVATQLRAEGRTTLANSLLALIMERWPSTPAGAEAGRLRGQMRTVVEERSGKTELLVFTTTYGLALGAAVPAAFGSEAAEAYGVGLIAGGPTGYFLGRQIALKRPVSEGQSRAISWGTIWGAWQGFGWAQALELGAEEVCSGGFCFTEDPDGETLTRAALIGSFAGLGTGLFLSRKDIPAGTATAVTFGSLWGTWFGVATGVLVDDPDENGLEYALVGGDIGLVVTALLAPRWQLSRSRARLISIAGVAGGLAGVGLLLITQPDGDGDNLIAVPMATSALGLALGAVWTRNYDERSAPRSREPEPDALLHWNRGLSLGMPEPALRMLPTDRRGNSAPAIAIPLLKARF